MGLQVFGALTELPVLQRLWAESWSEKSTATELKPDSQHNCKWRRLGFWACSLVWGPQILKMYIQFPTGLQLSGTARGESRISLFLLCKGFAKKTPLWNARLCGAQCLSASSPGRFQWIIVAFGVEAQLRIPVEAGCSPVGHVTPLRSYKCETDLTSGSYLWPSYS